MNFLCICETRLFDMANTDEDIKRTFDRINFCLTQIRKGCMHRYKTYYNKVIRVSIICVN